MMCEACERGDHDNCGMQTWCSCDCEGYQDGRYYVPDYDPMDREERAAREEAWWDGDNA